MKRHQCTEAPAPTTLPIIEMTTYSDANWAGCVKSRKSTSGGVIRLGDHLLRSWSKTQAKIALSSAESEFYATMKAAQESLGMAAMARELAMSFKIRILVDASAALGVAQRHGIGKIRHLQTGALWIQEQELKRILQMHKVNGTDNCSDILTKNVSREILERHCATMDMEYRDGRAEKAVQLHLVQRKVRQTKAEIQMLQNANIKDPKDEPIDANLLENCMADADCVLQKAMMKSDEVMMSCITEWERKLCRQEGLMRHWMKESHISTE